MKEKRYYWVKLKEDFFNSNEAKIIEGSKNGFMYICLFQKLLLLSANTDGWFITNAGEKTMPWSPKTLSRLLTGFSVKAIREGLALLLSVGLIYEVDGMLRISNFESYVGSETNEAVRKREYRKKKAEEKKSELVEASKQECSESSKEEEKASSSFYSEKTEKDFKHNTVAEDVQSSSYKNTEIKNTSMQENLSYKEKKPLNGGFYNKKVKMLYERMEGDIMYFSTNSSIRPFFYDKRICDRFLGVAREISRHESYNINSSQISSEELLKSINKLITANGNLIYKSFLKLDELLETTEIKNVLIYTITFLYNESFGCSQKWIG